jgi:YjjG family noncanonical pyrimidine nucleotidase
MGYEVLLSDADGTLFDFKAGEVNAIRAVFDLFGVANTPENAALYHRVNDEQWKLLEQGGITQKVLRVLRFEQFLEAIGRSDLNAQVMAETYANALGRQSVPIEGAIEAIARWSQIVPVIIVTNGISKIQHGRMNGSEVRHYIRGMVISEEVGAAKPDPKMLEIGMDMAKVTDKSRVLMLGDSLSSDIAAAANAGIDACWYNPKKNANTKGLPVRYEITDLNDVDGILLGKD